MQNSSKSILILRSLTSFCWNIKLTTYDHTPTEINVCIGMAKSFFLLTLVFDWALNQHEIKILFSSLLFISSVWGYFRPIPSYIYLFKVNNRNTRKSCEICSKLTIKTPERRQWSSGVFIVDFAHISHLLLVFLLLTVNK